MRGKLTKEQRTLLLETYLSKGFKAAKPLADQLGVKKRYMSNLARKNGHFNNYQRKDRETARPSQPNDPRWAWAIERGPICV